MAHPPPVAPETSSKLEPSLVIWEREREGGGEELFHFKCNYVQGSCWRRSLALVGMVGRLAGVLGRGCDCRGEGDGPVLSTRQTRLELLLSSFILEGLERLYKIGVLNFSKDECNSLQTKRELPPSHGSVFCCKMWAGHRSRPPHKAFPALCLWPVPGSPPSSPSSVK